MMMIVVCFDGRINETVLGRLDNAEWFPVFV